MTDVLQPDGAFHSGVDAQNPWPGLVAFTEDLTQFFHGRADEADDLLRRVGRKNLTVLFGQSGLGKSSLLQAGLFPRLRAEGYVPVAIRLDHAATAPSLAQQVITRVTRNWRRRGSGRGDGLRRHRDALGVLPPPHPDPPIGRRPADPPGVRVRPVRGAVRNRPGKRGHPRTGCPVRDRAGRPGREPGSRRPGAQLDDTPDLVKQFIFDDRDYRMLVCLREWLKTTKISPDVKVHVERFIHEMKGTPEALLELAARYEKATGVAVDLRKATHFCYLGHQKARKAAQGGAAVR